MIYLKGMILVIFAKKKINYEKEYPFRLPVIKLLSYSSATFVESEWKRT